MSKGPMPSIHSFATSYSEARDKFLAAARIAGATSYRYDNPSKGLPSGSGLMAVFDATTGMPTALLFDNGFLTDIRTGAAGAIAADVLAPKAIRTAGVLGSGLQARHQIHCLRCVRDFREIVAWSPTRAHLEA